MEQTSTYSAVRDLAVTGHSAASLLLEERPAPSAPIFLLEAVPRARLFLPSLRISIVAAWGAEEDLKHGACTILISFVSCYIFLLEKRFKGGIEDPT